MYLYMSLDKVVDVLKNMTEDQRLAATGWLQHEKHPLAMSLYVGLNHFTEPDYRYIENVLTQLPETLYNKIVAQLDSLLS